MNKAQAKAVVFDAYGTLFDINSLDEILAQHYGEQAGNLSNLWRKKQLEYTWLRTLMDRYKPFSEVTMDALSNACSSLGLVFNESIREELYGEYLQLKAYPEVPDFLKSLSGHVPVAVLSNANQLMLKGAINRNKLAEFFTCVLSIEEIRVYKPSPEVYQLASDRLNLDPADVLFVSSNTWDVAGAKSFGFNVAWLNRFGGVMETLDVEPNCTIKEMAELTDVIGYKL